MFLCVVPRDYIQEAYAQPMGGGFDLTFPGGDFPVALFFWWRMFCAPLGSRKASSQGRFGHPAADASRTSGQLQAREGTPSPREDVGSRQRNGSTRGKHAQTAIDTGEMVGRWKGPGKVKQVKLAVRWISMSGGAWGAGVRKPTPLLAEGMYTCERR